jgi:hypothetical protein
MINGVRARVYVRKKMNKGSASAKQVFHLVGFKEGQYLPFHHWQGAPESVLNVRRVDLQAIKLLVVQGVLRGGHGGRNELKLPGTRTPFEKKNPTQTGESFMNRY